MLKTPVQQHLAPGTDRPWQDYTCQLHLKLSESVYNFSTMHKDKPNMASTPLHFRVVDPAGMSQVV